VSLASLGNLGSLGKQRHGLLGLIIEAEHNSREAGVIK
jgi:hypothetical protein